MMQRWLGQLDFTQHWLLMIPVATAILAVSMLVLRVNVRTVIILYVIGLSRETR